MDIASNVITLSSDEDENPSTTTPTMVTCIQNLSPQDQPLSLKISGVQSLAANQGTYNVAEQIKERDATEVVELVRLPTIDLDSPPLLGAETPLSHVSNEEKFREFLMRCGLLEKNEKHRIKLLGKLDKAFKRCDPVYCNSKNFEDLLKKLSVELAADHKRLYFIMKELLDELKSKKVFSTSVPVPPQAGSEINGEKHNSSEPIEPGTSCEGQNVQENSVSKTQQRQLKKLERALEKLTKKIKKLEAAEVDFNDEYDSSFLRLRRYEQRSALIYKKLCELNGCSVSSGQLLKKKLKITTTQFKEMNEQLEKWVNKLTKFPDFGDVSKAMKEISSRLKIHLSSDQLRSMAQETFQEVGTTLQKRRKLDSFDTLQSYAVVTEDPADYDPQLDAVLRENKKIYFAKQQEIVDHFVRKQMEGNLVPEEVADDAPSSEGEQTPPPDDEANEFIDQEKAIPVREPNNGFNNCKLVEDTRRDEPKVMSDLSEFSIGERRMKRTSSDDASSSSADIVLVADVPSHPSSFIASGLSTKKNKFNYSNLLSQRKRLQPCTSNDNADTKRCKIRKLSVSSGGRKSISSDEDIMELGSSSQSKGKRMVMNKMVSVIKKTPVVVEINHFVVAPDLRGHNVLRDMQNSLMFSKNSEINDVRLLNGVRCKKFRKQDLTKSPVWKENVMPQYYWTSVKNQKATFKCCGGFEGGGSPKNPPADGRKDVSGGQENGTPVGGNQSDPGGGNAGGDKDPNDEDNHENRRISYDVDEDSDSMNVETDEDDRNPAEGQLSSEADIEDSVSRHQTLNGIVEGDNLIGSQKTKENSPIENGCLRSSEKFVKEDTIDLPKEKKQNESALQLNENSTDHCGKLSPECGNMEDKNEDTREPGKNVENKTESDSSSDESSKELSKIGVDAQDGKNDRLSIDGDSSDAKPDSEACCEKLSIDSCNNHIEEASNNECARDSKAQEGNPEGEACSDRFSVDADISNVEEASNDECSRGSEDRVGEAQADKLDGGAPSDKISVEANISNVEEASNDKCSRGSEDHVGEAQEDKLDGGAPSDKISVEANISNVKEASNDECSRGSEDREGKPESGVCSDRPVDAPISDIKESSNDECRSGCNAQKGESESLLCSERNDVNKTDNQEVADTGRCQISTGADDNNSSSSNSSAKNEEDVSCNKNSQLSSISVRGDLIETENTVPNNAVLNDAHIGISPDKVVDVVGNVSESALEATGSETNIIDVDCTQEDAINSSNSDASGMVSNDIDQEQESNDIEIISEKVKPRRAPQQLVSEEITPDERVTRFLQKAERSLEITVKRKRGMSDETKEALERLKRLKCISTTRVQRSDLNEEVVVVSTPKTHPTTPIPRPKMLAPTPSPRVQRSNSANSLRTNPRHKSQPPPSPPTPRLPAFRSPPVRMRANNYIPMPRIANVRSCFPRTPMVLSVRGTSRGIRRPVRGRPIRGRGNGRQSIQCVTLD